MDKISSVLGRSTMTSAFVILVSLLAICEGIRLESSDRSYAKFPRWNACINSSLSFDFKTSLENATLMYTDDGGHYDYVEVALIRGGVRLRMNIVDGKDGTIDITLGQRLNDNRWHRVEVKRNRMESILYVDDFKQSMIAYGSDFNFGKIETNSFVYFGGVPKSYGRNIGRLSLPSVLYEKRFVGHIRNVFYGNCTCKPVRGVMIEGENVSQDPKEVCEEGNRCGECLCITTDDGPGCSCPTFECAKDTDVYYHLPMDTVVAGRISNPSGLDANVTGSPVLVPGVIGNALRIQSRSQKITVSGPGHRNECFGDLSLCREGYTIGLWLRVEETGRGEGVYLSNGGHSLENHGVAMLYKIGRLQWVFRMKSGREWRTSAYNILPRHWYHVTVAWKESTGLVIYINGEKRAIDDSPITSLARGNPTFDVPLENEYKLSDKNDFVIGQANDGSGTYTLGEITIDDFQFWSKYLQENAVREMGPIYKYHITLDELHDNQLLIPNIEPRIRGILNLVPGKIGKAVSIQGRGEYIDLGSFSDNCIGNTSICKYGLTISLWIKFHYLKDNSFYIASGLEGFMLFYTNGQLYVTVQRGDRQWMTPIPDITSGNWYFLELTWSLSTGLTVYIDQKFVAAMISSNSHLITPTTFSNFYIGRANSAMYREKYGAATFDDIKMYNGHRDTLLAIDFIQRGKPSKNYYAFDETSDTDKIKHPNITITTRGSPKLVPGKVNNALWLNGRGQTAEFEHRNDCQGNLDYCNHGILFALWFRADRFLEGMHYLSSGINGVHIFVKDKKFHASITTSPVVWDVATADLEPTTWYYLEVTWSEEAGIKLYANDMLMAENKYPTDDIDTDIAHYNVGDRFYIGRENGRKSNAIYGAATYDEMEIWLGSRDYLLAFGYIQRGKPTSYRIKMDVITNGGRQIVNPTLPVQLHGYPLLIPGKINSAVLLSGNRQYIDLGVHSDTCLGSLAECKFGISIFFYIKIIRYENNMFILSTGPDGINILYNQGFFYVAFNNHRKSWRASIPREIISQNQWHFLEISWHKDFGLQVYVDGKLQQQSEAIDLPFFYKPSPQKFLIGAPNPDDVKGRPYEYARIAVDQLEIWYATREYLLAFDYILRDKVQLESFSMETASHGVINHPRYTPTLERGAQLVPGKVGKALRINGFGQFVDFGELMDECIANIELCHHGITISLWINMEELRNNTFILSSPTYSLYYMNGALRSKFMSNGKMWNVADSNRLKTDTWNKVVLSWAPDDGLEMIVGGDKVDSDEDPDEMMQGDEPDGAKLFVGKATDSSESRSIDGTVDELQFWYANIERLQAQGLYGGNLHESISFGKMPSNGILVLPTRTITLERGATVVQGQHSKAIRLNGKQQYIDMGDNLVCGGNLDNCPQGFTMRFSINPRTLKDNMYFLDSFPVSVFYQNRKLYATVRTAIRTWTVAAPDFKPNVWQVVDVSWHPEVGLTMYVDDKELGAHKTHGTIRQPSFDWDTTTYFGRAITKMEDERYADATVENFEVWNVRRDVLLANKRLPDINVAPVTSRPTSKPSVDVTTSSNVSNDAATTIKRISVTSYVTQGNAQYVPTTNLQVSSYGASSKVIRFHGNSFIRYDFNVLTYEMLSPTSNESLSFQFVTQDTDGLIWIFKGRNGRKMHVSIRGGSLLFVNDPGTGPAQQVVLRHPDSRALSDYIWHTFRIEKDSRVLRFYIDNKYAGTMTTVNDIQFVSRGEVYLGGTPEPNSDSGGVVDTNFNGAVTDVVSRKVNGPGKELIISFLKSVSQFNRTGDIDILDYDDVIGGTVIWDRTTPAPTPKPYAPTPITFESGTSTLVIDSVTDLRSGGEVSFRFRTLEPRGLLMLATLFTDYVGLEVFDGKLYFVYNLGSSFSRKELTDANVDDGEWHDFAMRVDGNQVFLTLDGRTIRPAQLSTDRLYFKKINIGGYGDFSKIPWALYSRQGYIGCFEGFKIKGIGLNLHNIISGAQGVELGCKAMPRTCRTQPCVSGYCKDRMEGYECICYNTRFTGRNCDEPAAIGSWDGTTSTNYDFLNRDVTHTNDISVRFMTPLRDTLLFVTETDKNDDFIKAELENGKVKVTMKAGSELKSFFVGENLNGYEWHTLNVMRRAGDVRIRVDDEPVLAGLIGGDNYQLTIDRIILGNQGNGQQSPNSYIGYMQNFIYGKVDVFSELKKLSSNIKWINSPEGTLPPIIFKPITVTTNDAFFQLRSLNIGLTMNLMFSFKTREPNGLLLYNGGIGKDVIAIELSNGMVRVAYNLGDRNMYTVIPSPKPLNDNKWHNVHISLNEKGLLHARADAAQIDVSTSGGDKRLSLTGNLYIAGLPEDMFTRREITNLIESRTGFRGCLASVDLNGAVPDLLSHTKDRQFVLNGCTDVNMTCKPNACGPGKCMPSVNDYWCDCNMTGYVGNPCANYPIGFYFGKNGRDGIVLYQFPFEAQTDSNLDQIAFGFMTTEENGVLYRIESGVGDDFIEIKLEDGFIVASSNTGTKTIVLSENAKKFNDGQYHVVRYIRDSTKSSMQIDSLPVQAVAHGGTVSVFDKVYRVMLGGRIDARGAQSNNFYGIMGGAYYNGYRWFDNLQNGVILYGKKVDIKGDVVLDNAYILVKRPLPTVAPTPIYIPPVEEIPSGIGGGGLVGPGISGGGSGGGGGVIGIGGPGGLTGVFGGVPVNVGGPPVTGPLMLAGPAPPPMATGARAGAVVGTVLGTMAFMTSLMWALYKLKPGVPTCLSPGAGSAGAGAGGGSGIVISSPRTASNLAAVQAVSGGGGAGGGGAGAGGSASKVTVVNGSAAGGGGAGAGGGSSTYTSYFQSTNASVQGGGAGAGGGGGAATADNVDSANLRATGRAHLGSASTNYSANYQTNTMQSYGSGAGTMNSYDRQYMAGNDNIPDYDMPMPGTMQSGHSYSSSTLNTHYNYQVQNLKTVTINRQGQYVMSGTSGGAVTPGAASDEVRVDCCLITGDRCHVVTGSSLGPPQVWDMQTGELQNIMKGDTVGSTDLHLVCGDRLLVGAVHADMEINEYSSRKGVFNHTLQIWDFQTGKPLSMAEGEYCSALCPMSDNDKVLFGRTDKFGDATSIIAWDLMGNQMIKEMRYDTPVGNNDYISYLNLSKNDRYVVAGFVNSFDNCAEFIVFDMTLTSYNIGEPAILKLDANPEVTAILPKDEAVTGLRNGDLVIWSIRTGQPSRQLLGSGGAHAHTREVKTVTLSEDGKYLISGSADGTLKVWDIHTERPIHTLAGHADEVWCSAISPDNEIVVSGSNDGTIRLWRMKNGSEMCVFNCGVDIFFVTMSHDKGTIVALGDKYGARKLIMLQVVRTKIKKIVSS